MHMVLVIHCIVGTVIDPSYILGIVLDAGLIESPSPLAAQSLTEEKVRKRKERNL